MSKCEKCGAIGNTETVVATNPSGNKRKMILCPKCAEQVKELIRNMGGTAKTSWWPF